MADDFCDTASAGEKVERYPEASARQYKMAEKFPQVSVAANQARLTDAFSR
jgi:hypothetical protein